MGSLAAVSWAVQSFEFPSLCTYCGAVCTAVVKRQMEGKKK